MKYLGPVAADEDVATKEYVDAGGSSGVSGPSYASAYRNAALNSSGAGGWTAYSMDTVSNDPEGWWDAVNGGFKPPAGMYLMTGKIGAGARCFQAFAAMIGSSLGQTAGDFEFSNGFGAGACVPILVDGTQTIKLGAYTTANGQAIATGPTDTHFSIIGPFTGASVGGGGLSTVRASHSVNVAAPTSITVKSWDTVGLDPANAYDAGDPTRLTVPSGFTKARASAYIMWSGSASGQRWAILAHNTTNIAAPWTTSTWEAGIYLDTGWLDVSPGDYFSVFTFASIGGLNILGDANASAKSWFGLELLP